MTNPSVSGLISWTFEKLISSALDTLISISHLADNPVILSYCFHYHHAKKSLSISSPFSCPLHRKSSLQLKITWTGRSKGRRWALFVCLKKWNFIYFHCIPEKFNEWQNDCSLTIFSMSNDEYLEEVTEMHPLENATYHHILCQKKEITTTNRNYWLHKLCPLPPSSTSVPHVKCMISSVHVSISQDISAHERWLRHSGHDRSHYHKVY